MAYVKKKTTLASISHSSCKSQPKASQQMKPRQHSAIWHLC